MVRMGPSPSLRTNLLAILVATTAALVARAWIQVELIARGAAKDHAADLSYLVVPLILVVLLYPVWRRHGRFIIGLFHVGQLSLGHVLEAISIGVLLRLAAWSQLIMGVSFGWYRNSDPSAVVGPTFAFDCPAPTVMLLGAAVMVVLVPLIEETINRGLVQSWLEHYGVGISIIASTLVFTLGHRPSAWHFVFLAGLVFGIQFWQTRTIWCSLISHATVNGLIQVDWRCLHGRWNPPASDIPLWGPGLVSIATFALAVVSIGLLLWRKKAGVRSAPRQ